MLHSWDFNESSSQHNQSINQSINIRLFTIGLFTSWLTSWVKYLFIVKCIEREQLVFETGKQNAVEWVWNCSLISVTAAQKRWHPVTIVMWMLLHHCLVQNNADWRWYLTSPDKGNSALQWARRRTKCKGHFCFISLRCYSVLGTWKRDTFCRIVR